jgi:hypothetical protein
VTTSESTTGHVGVRLVFDTVPNMNRHRVQISDANGAVLWLTGGPCPETMDFVPGDVLIAHASIAAPPGASSTDRPSREWRLRVARGAQAVLRLGTTRPFSTSQTLEVHVEGAQLDRRRTPQ